MSPRNIPGLDRIISEAFAHDEVRTHMASVMSGGADLDSVYLNLVG